MIKPLKTIKNKEENIKLHYQELTDKLAILYDAVENS